MSLTEALRRVAGWKEADSTSPCDWPLLAVWPVCVLTGGFGLSGCFQFRGREREEEERRGGTVREDISVISAGM